jgi:hypothetical protein
MKNAHEVLVRKTQGKRPHRRPWVTQDNTKIKLGETGHEGNDTIQLLRIGSSGGLL